MKQLLCLAFCAFIAGGCSGSSDIVVLNKSVHKDSNVSAAIPGEFGGTAPSLGELYWVEGKVQNRGTEEVLKVTITFRCTDGNNRRLFVAEVDRIPPGATVSFHTDKYPSPLEIRLLEGDPEIKIGS